MIYLIQATNKKKLLQAYFLASALRSIDLILPISNHQVFLLSETTLQFLKLDYCVIDINILFEIKSSYLSEKDIIFYKKICLHTTLHEIALYNSIPLYFIKHKTQFEKECSTFKDAYIISRANQISSQAIQYSLLTGRSLIITNPENDNDLFAIFHKARSYFISFEEDITTSQFIEFLNNKFLSNNDVPFALMYPYGEVEREYFIIKTLLFSRFDYPGEKKLSFYYPLEQSCFNYENEKISIYSGRNQDILCLLKALAQPQGLLFSMAHSNGVDMVLGNIILCPRGKTPVNQSDIIKAMPCFFDMSLCSRKSSKTDILSLSELKAKIAFFYTCWGVLLKGGLYDPNTSLARQIILSPYVGMFISTYTMSHLDKSIASEFIKLYFDSMSFGKIVKKLNDKHYDLYKDNKHTLILLGDPEYKSKKLLSDPMNYLLPKKIKDFLNSKGIFTSYPKYIISSEPDSISIFIKKFLSDIILTNIAIAGSKTLQNIELQSFLDLFSKEINNFWSFLLIIIKRIKESDKQQIDTKLVNSQIKALISIYQDCWVNYFLFLNKKFGGLVRLQLDKYFYISSEENEKLNLSHKCPYCAGFISIKVFSLVEHSQVTRKIIECFNCTTIFDGNTVFEFAQIKCLTFWKKNVAQPITLEIIIKNLARGNYIYTVLACLEPFNKKNNEPISSLEKRGEIAWNGGLHDKMFFNIDYFMPNEKYTLGQYHLNILLIVGTSVLFLRRAIYLNCNEDMLVTESLRDEAVLLKVDDK